MALLNPKRELIDRLVPGGLDDYVVGRRAEGLSWDLVAASLYRDFDLKVSSRSLRDWYVEQAAS